MLAENRRKQSQKTWTNFCMNPRGELWTKDESSFGRKLLKKMGWKKGDGLGKTGSGITQPIRVAQKQDNEGLGYSKHQYDNSWNWLANQDDFDCMLTKLNEQYFSPSEDMSREPQLAVDLEKKSKKSQKRVHYQRAIEGKNLSNRSQSDWKCILGYKRKRKYPQESDLDLPQEVESDQGLLHTSAVSSQEYFMLKRRKVEKTNEENGKLDVSEQSTQEGMLIRENSHAYPAEQEMVSSCLKKKKNRKRRKERKLGELDKKSLEESEKGGSDSAICSEVSGSCDGDQKVALETLSASADQEGVGSRPSVKVKQNDCVVDEDRLFQPEQETFSSCLKKKMNKKRGKKRKLEELHKKSLEESEGQGSDSAVGSEVSGSCVAEQNGVAETVSAIPDHQEVMYDMRINLEEQNDRVVMEERQFQSDELLEQTGDIQLEKENHYKAEDSLIVLRKSKRKKRKRQSKLEPISVMTKLERSDQCKEDSCTILCPNANIDIDMVKSCSEGNSCSETVSRHYGILKTALLQELQCKNTLKCKKKSVRFLKKPIVGYVPARDPVRGTAWIWKRKIRKVTSW